MIHDRLPIAHGIQDRPDGMLHSYWGACSCGWVSEPQRDQDEAKRLRDEHVALAMAG